MSLAAAPVRTLTTNEWYELFHDYEGGRCELVRGHAIMTPSEAIRNNRATHRIGMRLTSLLGSPWEPLTNTSVVIADDPLPTTRVPDLVVIRSSAVGREWKAQPSDIALVVEVISPSSVEADWVSKRDEYAAAGIPLYAIADVRDDAAPRIWLFDQIVTDAAGGTTYADPTGDGHTVTLHLPGCDPITITATDLTGAL